MRKKLKNLFHVFLCAAIAFCPITLKVSAYDWLDVKPSITDQEFFGEWNGTDWSVEPKFNYDYNEGMRKIGDIVKNGDYIQAKAELFEYYKNNGRGYQDMPARDTNTANLAADNVLFTSRTFINRAGVSGTTFHPVSIDVTRQAAEKRLMGICIMAVKKSNADIVIGAENSESPPILSVVVDGAVRVYNPVNTAYVSTTVTEISPEYLLVRESGYPFDSDSKRAVLRFDLSGIPSTAVVSAAVLNLNVKSYDNEENDLLLWDDPEPNSAPSWRVQSRDVYSFNGATLDHVTFTPPAGYVNFELITRLPFIPAMAAEYMYTGDEHYAENAIRLILAYFYHHSTSKSVLGGIGVGGYSESLCTAIRLLNINNTLPYFMLSDNMTPERYTEIMKNIWIMTNYLRAENDPEAYHPWNNWGSNETNGFMSTPKNYPEFALSPLWHELTLERIQDTVDSVPLPDGSLVESSLMYTNIVIGHLNSFFDYVEDKSILGEDFFKVYNQAGEWSMNLTTPSGEGTRWGDSGDPLGGATRGRTTRLGILAKNTGNPMLEYYYSYGQSGEMAYTSKFYPDKQAAFMRSGWQKDDLYLMIENSPVGSHVHHDDLAVIVAGYGHTFLTDQGFNNYNPADTISKEIRHKTWSHNTVSINAPETTERIKTDYGNTTDFFTTSNELDFYQGTKKSYADFDHTRAVTFIRPNYWVVSDYLRPHEVKMADINLYEQNWHSSNDFTFEGKTGKTSFEDGIFMQIVPVDSGETPVLKTGYFVPGSDIKVKKYLAYQKKQSGIVTFDTVLYPNNLNDSTVVTTEKFQLEQNANATASKINFDDGQNITSDYYYLSYGLQGEHSEATFGKYTFDGKLCVAENDSRGNTVAVSIVDAKKISENGIDLIRSYGRVENLTVEWDSSFISVEITAPYDIENGDRIYIYAPNELNWVKINGKDVSPQREGDYIYFGM